MPVYSLTPSLFHQRKLWTLINVIYSAPPNTNAVWARPNGTSALPLPAWLIEIPVQSFFWLHCVLSRHTYFLWTFLSDEYGAKVIHMGIHILMKWSILIEELKAFITNYWNDRLATSITKIRTVLLKLLLKSWALYSEWVSFV